MRAMRKTLPLLPLIPLILMILPVAAKASDWQELSTKLERSVWASSVFCEEIGAEQVCYTPEQLFDGDPGTCWVEAAPGGGIGEWVLFAVNRPVEGLRVTNGFARSPALYRSNNRLERVRLQDIPEPQLVEFSVTYEEHRRLVWEALDRFYDSYPFFMREIEKDLGLEPNLGKEQLKPYQDLIFSVRAAGSVSRLNRQERRKLLGPGRGAPGSSPPSTPGSSAFRAVHLPGSRGTQSVRGNPPTPCNLCPLVPEGRPASILCSIAT